MFGFFPTRFCMKINISFKLMVFTIDDSHGLRPSNPTPTIDIKNGIILQELSQRLSLLARYTLRQFGILQQTLRAWF